MTLAHGAIAKRAQSPLLSAALYDIMIQHWGEFDVAAAKLLLLGKGLVSFAQVCVESLAVMSVGEHHSQRV